MLKMCALFALRSLSYWLPAAPMTVAASQCKHGAQPACLTAHPLPLSPLRAVNTRLQYGRIGLPFFPPAFPGPHSHHSPDTGFVRELLRCRLWTGGCQSDRSPAREGWERILSAFIPSALCSCQSAALPVDSPWEAAVARAALHSALSPPLVT